MFKVQVVFLNAFRLKLNIFIWKISSSFWYLEWEGVSRAGEDVLPVEQVQVLRLVRLGDMARKHRLVAELITRIS